LLGELSETSPPIMRKGSISTRGNNKLLGKLTFSNFNVVLSTNGDELLVEVVDVALAELVLIIVLITFLEITVGSLLINVATDVPVAAAAVPPAPPPAIAPATAPPDFPEIAPATAPLTILDDEPAAALAGRRS